MIDKQQLERMYKHNLKVKKVLFIISMVLFGLATAFLAGFLAIYISGKDIELMPELFEGLTLSYLMLDLFNTAISAAIVLLLFSLLIFARRARFAKAMLDDYDRLYAEQSRVWNTKPSGAPVVDVKPVEQEKPKGKYDDLIREYEKLCEQGYISKEDLEKKKAELLNQ